MGHKGQQTRVRGRRKELEWAARVGAAAKQSSDPLLKPSCLNLYPLPQPPTPPSPSTGFTQVEIGLRLSDVSNSGSYQSDFAQTLEENFLMYSGVMMTVSNDFPGAQSTILEALTELQESEWVSPVPRIQNLYWLTNLLENEGTDMPLPENEFYDRLAAYLGGLGVTYAQDLYCINTNTNARVSCLEMYNSLDQTRNPNVELAATRGSFYIQVRAWTWDVGHRA